MVRRLELHEKMCSILKSRNVYFQPPASKQLIYDCITYKKIRKSSFRADDRRYHDMDGYEVVFITRDPDSSIPDLILDSFTYVSDGVPFVAENLHHYPFTIYY